MSEALFGLIGVVVGGLLTGSVEYLAKLREERAMRRTLARAIYAALLDLRSQCVYCREQGSWLLVAEPFKLPAAWSENELALARLFSWDQWAALQAVRASQFALRMLAVQARDAPGLEETHLPTVNDAALAALNNAMPDVERLAGSKLARDCLPGS